MKTSFLVRPIEANLVHSPEWQLKMDPFCRIFLGQQVQQTSTCSHGAKNPKWGDTLIFSNTGDQELRIEVWDNEIQSDKFQLLGSGSVNLSKIMTHGVGTSTWIDIGFKGKSAGRICVGIQLGGFGAGQGMGQQISKEIGQAITYGQGQALTHGAPKGQSQSMHQGLKLGKGQPQGISQAPGYFENQEQGNTGNPKQ